jgi:3-hydroxyanthranilate 3,4-dioxygenase
METTGAQARVKGEDVMSQPNGIEPDGSVSSPVHLMNWVMQNKDSFKPPVGNKYLYSGEDFFVMLIAGPNARNDFHKTNSEEFFIQLTGDIVVKTYESGRIVDHVVHEGETFFIPPNVPHAPCRPEGTLGMVIERRRPPGELEHQIFYCEKCNALVHDNEFDCADIVEAFRDAMQAFWDDPERSTCGQCGTRVPVPGPYVMPEELK